MIQDPEPYINLNVVDSKLDVIQMSTRGWIKVNKQKAQEMINSHLWIGKVNDSMMLLCRCGASVLIGSKDIEIDTDFYFCQYSDEGLVKDIIK